MTTTIALFGCIQLTVVVAMMILRVRRWSVAMRVVALLVLYPVAAWPFAELSAAGYVYGFTSNISVTGLILLIVAALSILLDRDLVSLRENRVMLTLLAGTALFFYPFALGLSYFDAYEPGYGSQFFFALVIGVAFVTWLANLQWIALCIIASCAAYLAGVYESMNLWDYLIDPVIGLFAVVWLLGRPIDMIRRRSGRTTTVNETTEDLTA